MLAQPKSGTATLRLDEHVRQKEMHKYRAQMGEVQKDNKRAKTEHAKWQT
jgi:FtsZ-binding cell division protein ZapB